jgi:hypothetical protein
LLWKLQRATALGTTTPFTPIALDSADPAAIATFGTAASAEPTYTASAFLFWLALNQRATHRAILDPMGPLCVPASANNGIGVLDIHATFTGNADCTVYYFE